MLQYNPCHTAGLITSGDQNDNNVLRNVSVQGFRYGFVFGEHVIADYLYAPGLLRAEAHCVRPAKASARQYEIPPAVFGCRIRFSHRVRGAVYGYTVLIPTGERRSVLKKQSINANGALPNLQ